MSEQLTSNGAEIFRASRRGYDRDEVDAYVAELRRQINDLQAQVSSPEAAVRSALERVGGEVAEVLQQAHDTAARIVAEAQAEAAAHSAAVAEHAAAVTAAAAEHAAAVTAAAEQRVHELDLDTDRIWSERERIMTDTRELSRQLLAIAELAAERFPPNQPVAGGDAQQVASDERSSGWVNAGN